jgi:hypothetical protein
MRKQENHRFLTLLQTMQRHPADGNLIPDKAEKAYSFSVLRIVVAVGSDIRGELGFEQGGAAWPS